ncbi:MAG: hypothetical protein CVV47_03955 [Spirochaetae bacterium HGW-Spirochaetae-3]|jgi:long-chain acyl-CoA synthetase|nr:MAG: hypothetical protein CVV47_03955 [Spirochaetae bacterium HGW-Spirochaetae-3]
MDAPTIRNDSPPRLSTAAIGSAILAFDSGVGVDADSFRLAAILNDALAAIVYTSGTTGFSKGVMLTRNSFISNLVYSQKNVFLFPGERFFSFLPLAHMFWRAFEFILPFSRGCHITFLGKIPATSVLFEAFATIRPSLVLTVPLVIEKIYYRQIRPMIGEGVPLAVTTKASRSRQAQLDELSL